MADCRKTNTGNVVYLKDEWRRRYVVSPHVNFKKAIGKKIRQQYSASAPAPESSSGRSS